MNPAITCQAFRPAVCNDRSTTLQLWLRLEPPRFKSGRRPSLNLGLSIDRSGSMGGTPIDCARHAAMQLIENMEATDQVSVVCFDDIVDVLAPCARVNRQTQIHSQLANLQARGSTNLYQGWLEAACQIQGGSNGKQIDRVVLLSDGQANAGITAKDSICNQVRDWCQRKGISTTTVGLGLGYNEDLLAGMADAGNGNFYHIEDPSDIQALFQVELQGLANTFGTKVRLGIEELSGVELLRVVNPLSRDQQGRLQVANLVHGNPIDIILELQVPPQSKVTDLCRFKLNWTDIETGEKREFTRGFHLPVVPHGQLVEFPVCREVLHRKAIQMAARTLAEAVRAIDKNEHGRAKSTLQSGLADLRESGDSTEVRDYTQQFEDLLSKLERGAVAAVRKGATSIGRSVSIGSVSLVSGPLKEFMELPAEERTPERLAKIMERYTDS